MKRWSGTAMSHQPPCSVVEQMVRSCRRYLRVRPCRYIITFTIGALIVYKLLLAAPSEIRLPRHVDVTKFPPFEPEVTSDIPAPVGGTGSEIPKIIHQTWADEYVPAKFVNNIKSFTQNNPSWKYYLWTDDALTLLIEKHFPDLLPVWNSFVYSYHHRHRRFNAARYLIIYMYGGLFVDMDTINHRSLEPAMRSYNCIIPPEPYEQTFSTFTGFTLTNSLLLCKAKHPFFRFMVDNLHRYLHLSHSWDSAGPGYLTSQYRLYTKMPNVEQATSRDDALKSDVDSRPYVVRDDLSLGDPAAIYVPNSHYFTGSSDASLHAGLRRQCESFESLHPAAQKVCAHLSRRGLVRGRDRFTFTEHLWQDNWHGRSNWYIYTGLYIFFFGTDIHDIVPHCKIPFVDTVS